MRIELKNNWSLKADSKQFIIFKIGIKENEYNHRYYSNLESALSGILNILIRESKATSFEELKKDINECTKLIKSKKEELKALIKEKQELKEKEGATKSNRMQTKSNHNRTNVNANGY